MTDSRSELYALFFQIHCALLFWIHCRKRCIQKHWVTETISISCYVYLQMSSEVESSLKRFCLKPGFQMCFTQISSVAFNYIQISWYIRTIFRIYMYMGNMRRYNWETWTAKFHLHRFKIKFLRDSTSSVLNWYCFSS